MIPDELDLHDIQGLVARGYGGLPEAAYLLLQVEVPADARAMLHGLTSDVTTADAKPSGTATNLALTAHGVRALTGEAALVTGFSPQFAAGMVGPHVSRFLGDLGDSSPDRWAWGGPTTDEVHVLLLVYGADDERLANRCDDLVAAAGAGGLRLLHRLTSTTLTPAEAFGFRDGISQPALAGFGRRRQGQPGIRSGEVVLGYPNEYDQLTQRPLLPAESDPDGILPRDPGGSGEADLGRNGSYLVYRQLEQDVQGFWDFLDAAATDDAGQVDEDRRNLLAAKMMGRWPSGAPLVLAPLRDDASLADANDFGYHVSDELGFDCPLGSHVRRTNPRDSLEPSPGTAQSWAINSRHRLLRRGRAYQDGLHEQGLHFICLNANIARQYEFVQHSWVNNPAFNGMHGEDDPVIGPRLEANSFTEPARPVRRRRGDLPQFVRVRGGGYFFLPGIGALRYLTRATR